MESTTLATSKPVAGIPFITLQDMRRAGYEPRDSDLALLIHLTNPDQEDGHNGIVTGPPGAGKTFFALKLSEAITHKLSKQYPTVTCAYFEMLMHSWISNEEMYAAPHIGNIAVGVEDREEAYRKGILWLAAEASLRGPVVLCLDEIDKCQQRSENLLLTFLQTGRVQDSNPDGGTAEVMANLDNLIVVMTSNATRELGEPTKRRAFRYEMTYLSVQVETKLLHRLTGAPVAAVNALVQAANKIRESMSSSPSLQEMKQLLLNVKYAPTAEIVAVMIQGQLCKRDQDMSPEDMAKLASTLYAAYGVDGRRVVENK